jgi:hypothetical protein
LGLATPFWVAGRRVEYSWQLSSLSRRAQSGRGINRQFQG